MTDKHKRCWGNENKLALDYHDKEWGVPVYNDKIQFEFLVLESAQAGLSWMTVLRKRENYRKAFDNFNPEKIAAYDEKKIVRLLQNSGIIRNRKKIEAAIGNALSFMKIQREYGSFCNYFWNFSGGKPITNRWKKFSEIPVTTELSDTITKDMKKRGFKFLGSTIMYAHMQGVGMVNDHLVSCFRHGEIENMS